MLPMIDDSSPSAEEEFWKQRAAASFSIFIASETEKRHELLFKQVTKKSITNSLGYAPIHGIHL